jgi:hypothetical protein
VKLRLLMLIGAALIVGLTSACAAPRSAPTASTAACAVTLPIAERAIHGRGRLVAVRVVESGHVRKLPLGVHLPSRRRRCLLVYRGPYRNGDVAGARGAGRYAIFFVRIRHPSLVRVAVSDQLPPEVRRRKTSRHASR